jgi:hypothetical protein
MSKRLVTLFAMRCASLAAFAFLPVEWTGMHAVAAEAGEDRLVVISRFDCVRSDDAADAPAFPWDKGIGRWKSGGPGGAAWNAPGLRCVVEFQANCARGIANAELRVGGALTGAKPVEIGRAGLLQATFDLPAGRWEKHLDQVSPATKRLPYRTATFSASVMASCEEPALSVSGTGPRLEFADDRHFTAGFAAGE